MTQRVKRYLVGGAVRDHLLGIPSKDRDWVVIGETPESMIEKGYRQVGKDFPVFLDDVGEEHALARREKKVDPGYRGFIVETGVDVTLEEDLYRRDLTINAMAMMEDGTIIDPYGGQRDIKEGVLRHVSEAFREDPVRVLRIARFHARYAGHRGFGCYPVIDRDTRYLMYAMVKNGELDALTPERVWLETVKALMAPVPELYFYNLECCGGLEILFPELHTLINVPQPAKHHPEIDTFKHVMMALKQAVMLSHDTRVRFAVLVHDLGKGATLKSEWPHHHTHEELGLPLVEAFCDRYHIPNDYRRLAKLVTRHHTKIHRAFDLRPKTLLDLFDAVGGYHDTNLLEPFLVACEADARGREGFQDRDYPQVEYVRKAYEVAKSIRARGLVNEGFVGTRLLHELTSRRVRAIKKLRREYGNTNTENV